MSVAATAAQAQEKVTISDLNRTGAKAIAHVIKAVIEGPLGSEAEIVEGLSDQAIIAEGMDKGDGSVDCPDAAPSSACSAPPPLNAPVRRSETNAQLPRMTGWPGFSRLMIVSDANPSAQTWARVPASAAGAVAPAWGPVWQ